jgi:hypothetical protein
MSFVRLLLLLAPVVAAFIPRSAAPARGLHRSATVTACTTDEAQKPTALSRLEVFADDAAAEASLSETQSFGSLGVSLSGVETNLKAAGITVPNALQRASFEPISSGRDTILHAWTGSGKTLAFLLPLLERLDPSLRVPQALIICPSRELAFQIQRVADAALAGTSLGSAAVIGGANANRQLAKIKQERPQIIVGTPGRLCELAFEWKKLKLASVRHIIIDEVDQALRAPHLDDTLRLLHTAQDGRPLQLVLASATADTPPVRRTAAQLLSTPLLLRLLPGSKADHDGRATDPHDETEGGGAAGGGAPGGRAGGGDPPRECSGRPVANEHHAWRVRGAAAEGAQGRARTPPHHAPTTHSRICQLAPPRQGRLPEAG